MYPMRSRTASGLRATSIPATKALPAGGPQQAAQNADGGRLAGAVGPQKADDFPAADGKADMIHGGEVAEALDQPFDDDRILVFRSGPLNHVDSLRAAGARSTRLRHSVSPGQSRSRQSPSARKAISSSGIRLAASSTTAWTPSPTIRTLPTPLSFVTTSLRLATMRGDNPDQRTRHQGLERRGVSHSLSLPSCRRARRVQRSASSR